MAGIPYVQYSLCIDGEYSLYGMPAIFINRRYYLLPSEGISPVQKGHFTALILIFEQQRGHSLVVGASGFCSFLKWNLLIDLTIRKSESATNRKLITA